MRPSGDSGVEGFTTSLRAVAAEAGVSPGLVIHHFGSKDGLRAVCDQYVLQVVRELKAQSFATAGPAEWLRQWSDVQEYAPLVGYLMQTLLTGGDLAATLLEQMTKDAEANLAEAVAAGLIKPSRDPAVRAAYLVDLGIGVVLSFIRRHPPVDRNYRSTLQAYVRTNTLPALELYTEGLLTDSSMLDAFLQHVHSVEGRDRP